MQTVAALSVWTCGKISTAPFVVTDWMSGIDEMPKHEADHHVRMLRRIVLSALPIVAEAAKIDLVELDADYLLHFADREFPPVIASLPDGGGEAGFGSIES